MDVSTLTRKVTIGPGITIAYIDADGNVGSCQSFKSEEDAEAGALEALTSAQVAAKAAAESEGTEEEEAEAAPVALDLDWQPPAYASE